MSLTLKNLDNFFISFCFSSVGRDTSFSRYQYRRGHDTGHTKKRLEVPACPKTPAALPLERRLYPAIVVAHFPKDVDSKEV